MVESSPLKEFALREVERESQIWLEGIDASGKRTDFAVRRRWELKSALE